jgi:glycosyltransferase involved in cell wall biosynthesis
MPTERKPASVVFVANSAKIGGGAKVLMDLMLHLDPNRYVPSIVAPEPGPLVDWAVGKGISHHISGDGDWSSARDLARRTVQFLRIARRLRPGILHAAAPMCYRAAGLAGRIAGVARVCHLGFPPQAGELERSFLSGPDAVIGCYVQQAADERGLIARLAPACRVVGIPNGIDTTRFSPTSPPGEDRDRWRFGAKHVVVILGHLSDVKGHPTFIDAASSVAARLPDTAFVVVGTDSTQPGFQRTLEQQAAGLGIGERVHFVGFQTDVAPILRAADVVALPSLAEGFPLAVLEAMACGKTVVATPVGGVEEAVSDDVSGLLVPPGRADVLGTALLDVLSNPARAKALGQAARRRVEERFSVTLFADRVQQLYDELLIKKRAGQHARLSKQAL